MKNARFIFMLIIALLLFTPVSIAEQAISDAAALQALQAAHPGYTVTAQEQCGYTAAAVLSLEGKSILCIAEKQSGVWTVTIDNPAALRQGEQIPSLLLDTDDTLFWAYHNNDTLCEYVARKENGSWGNVDHRFVDAIVDGEGDEYTVTWKDLGWCKVISKSNWHQDENENLLYGWADIPIPADWLASYADLAHFDVERFPRYYWYTHDWTNEYVRQGAAEQLMPEYIYHGGTINTDTMEFLMEKPDGALVFVGVTWNELEGWLLTVSTPLPKGTVYGYQNFESSLYLPNGQLVSMKRYSDGTWGVYMIYAEKEDGTSYPFFDLGQNWVGDIDAIHAYGTHPWSDMTKLDWTTLPRRLEDAMQIVDSSDWVVVNNPNPEDRLHLRTAPSRDAASLGKYYNNTPVRVLGTDGDWFHVSVFGVEGYMLRRYLATGEAMNSVETAGSVLNFNGYPTELYQSPQSEHPFYIIKAPGIAGYARIIGIGGDQWYHVWFVDTGLSGYIRQSDMVAGGNG